ncbi:MAG TPA: hypothetical protein VIJ83_05695 [Solirubrobacteraceae bacterium]
MPSRTLHAALQSFVVEASAALREAIAAGDEVGFEVIASGSGRQRRGLYCYEALTGEFIDRHWGRLLVLPAGHEAQMELAEAGGLEEYLDTYAREHRGGVPVLQDVLRCFTQRVFDGCSESFEVDGERFEAAFGEIQRDAEEEGEVALLALLRGIVCKSAEVAIDDGVMLAPLTELELLPPDPLWRREHGPATVVALVPGRSPGSFEESLGQLRDLQTALRLYAPGISLAPLAWMRGRRSVWRALPIPGAGRSDGCVIVTPESEAELRAFAAVVARRRPAEGELAWALERFELGQEREDPLSGLTDNLLALRALLEPEGPRSGRLAGRIAALCAQPAQRIPATERVAHAISLEQSLIAGVSVGHDAGSLASEIEQHLRALLRDVICGHLDGDLVALADSLLAEGAVAEAEPAAPEEIRASRRHPPAPADPDDWFGVDEEVDYCATEGESTLFK